MRLRLAVAVSLVLSGFLALPSHASCGVSGVRGRDPGHAALNAEIDRAAARHRVPPFVLKSVAWHESRWRQFHADGRVALSGDCAIGALQVLASGGFSAYRLATDYRYNVDAGARVLAAKMAASSANVPSRLGADERRVAENWYRATYRYNGSGYTAMRYADAVFATIASPPSEIRPWVAPVPVASPRGVLPGYTPTSGHGYVARLDGTWASTLGTYRHAVTRGDFLAGSARAGAGASLEGDQRRMASFVARNLGWAPWPTSRVSLATYPLGRASRLRHPSWISSTRPVAVSTATAPGAVGTFRFPVKAARVSSAVTFGETFAPVLDGAVSLAARATSTWTVNPVRVPVARVTSAPEYLTDASTGSVAALGLSFSDPAPGSGVAYVQLVRRAPGATSWSAPARVRERSVRLSFKTTGVHWVRVRAVDRAGHAGAWTSPTRVVVPRDDTDAVLAFDGAWSSASVSGSWLGSLAAARDGASVTLPVSGSSYALIGTRGPGLAPLTVYLDGVFVTVVNPVAETTRQRQVLWEATLSPGDHTLRVVVTGSRAYLDAVAVA